MTEGEREEWKADIIPGPPLDFGANNCNGPETRNGPLKVVGSTKSSADAFKFEGS